jgi:membrane-associated protein
MDGQRSLWIVRHSWLPLVTGRAGRAVAGTLAVVHADLVSALNPLSAQSWISAFGTFGIGLVLFLETGTIVIGIFLPGDSLLFTAGLLCTTSSGSTIHLSLPWVILSAAVGAIAGAQTGFLIGRHGGRPLLARYDSPRIQDGVVRSNEFLDRYGPGKALVLARFVPVIRTILNPLVGVLHLPGPVFTRWNVVGGLLWTIGVTMAGYLLGSSIHNIDHYLLPIILLIIIVSLIPVVLEIRRGRRAN